MISTFDIDKSHTFVAGLFWQPLSGSTSEYRKETQKLAKQLNLDLAVWRTMGVLQVGMGSSSENLKPGMLSAAAVISKTLEVESHARDFLCATEITDGRWLYVAQSDGVILPDGDLIGGEDEIKSRLLSDLSTGKWSLVFAPEHWGVHGAAEERSFEDFIPKRSGKYDYKKWWRLRPIDSWSSFRAKPSKIIIPAMILALLAEGGMYAYKTWQNKKAAEEARIAAIQAAATSAPVKVIEHPWKSQPSARSYLNSCITAMEQVKSLWPGNWTLQGVNCANGSMTVQWKRQEYGWIKHLREVEPNVTLSSDGESALLSIPLKLANGTDEAVPQESERTLAMYGVAQEYRFPVTITTPPAPVVMPGQENANKSQAQDWREIKWEAKGITLPPDVVLAALDGKGFRLTQAQAVFNGGIITWNMEGRQYVQP
jgi:hypothetical protein